MSRASIARSPVRLAISTQPAGSLCPNCRPERFPAHGAADFDRRAVRRERLSPVRTAAVACLAALAILCCAWQAFGNEPGKDDPPPLDLTLKDSVLLALRNNRHLINARLDRAAERFSLRVAENEFRPHVTIGPFAERKHTNPSTGTGSTGVSSRVMLRIPSGGEFEVGWRGGGETGDTGSRPPYFNEVEFTFRQPLLRGAGVGVNTASVRTARLAEEISVLVFKQAIIDIVSEVVRSYRGYMQAERRVDIRAKSLDRARELLAVNELLVETGRMAERDILQTKADIARRELRLIGARNRLDAARLTLIDILDIDSRTRLRLTETLDVGDSLDSEFAQTDAAHGVEAALRHRTDYLRALLGIRNAEIRVDVAGNERLWDLSVTLSARLAHADETLGGAASRLDGTDYGVRLDLAIPIGPAAADPAKLAYANAATDLKKARNELADLLQRIDIEVGNAVREVEISALQVGLTRTARRLVEQKLEVEKEKLRLGLSSNFRLSAFEDDLVAAQDDELDSIVAYLDALTLLDRTLGTTLDSWGIEVEGADRGRDR